MDEDGLLSIYCERAGPGLWAEPLNAITNLAFVLAALLASRGYIESGLPLRRSWELWLLILLLFAIGVGSGLWHSYATLWAGLADVIPIVLFINVFLLSFLVRVAGLGVVATVGWFVAFQLLNALITGTAPPDLWNGSVFYLPAWIGLAAMTGYLWPGRSPARWHFAGALGLFTLSLTMRSVDRAVCDLLPWGTHFLWHLLNASLLYLLLLGLMLAIPPSSPTALDGGHRRQQPASSD